MPHCTGSSDWMGSSVIGTPAVARSSSSPSWRPCSLSPGSVTAPTSLRSLDSKMHCNTARPIRPAAPRTPTFNKGSCSHALEELFHAVEPRPRAGTVPAALALDRGVKYTELLLLLGRETHGRLDLDTTEQISDTRV